MQNYQKRQSQDYSKIIQTFLNLYIQYFNVQVRQARALQQHPKALAADSEVDSAEHLQVLAKVETEVTGQFPQAKALPKASATTFPHLFLTAAILQLSACTQQFLVFAVALASATATPFPEAKVSVEVVAEATPLITEAVDWEEAIATPPLQYLPQRPHSTMEAAAKATINTANNLIITTFIQFIIQTMTRLLKILTKTRF
eukprot:TRINITY_DN685_c0_g1_i2.p3 TRINITY_DN685_c0_g1~~TRINITY_DN685_c0_g1_i2.p3  ORF type:complete len:201 (-),score=0.74 TRINITY_DN685_c0_g1_i2:83-685(-)